MVLIPPPIQGLGLSGGFQLQVQLADGTFDYTRLESMTRALETEIKTDPAVQAAFESFHAIDVSAVSEAVPPIVPLLNTSGFGARQLSPGSCPTRTSSR